MHSTIANSNPIQWPMLPSSLKQTTVLASSLLSFLSFQFLSSSVLGARRRVVASFDRSLSSSAFIATTTINTSSLPRFCQITSAVDSPRFSIRKPHDLSPSQPRLRTKSVKMQVEDNISSKDEMITILGFGSLLSQKSSQVTFPALRNFRLGRVRDHRRVFAHPASIFFRRGIANLATLEMSSLSVEYAEGHSFLCAVFEVPNEGLSAIISDGSQTGNWIPSQAFLEREEEFEIVMVPYEEVESVDDIGPSDDIAAVVSEKGTITDGSEGVDYDRDGDSDEDGNGDETIPSIKTSSKSGIICRRSTDEAYLSQWGKDHFQKQYLDYGVKTIWGWDENSGLRPCPVYLRHCVLASWNSDNVGCEWSSVDDENGGMCYNSFLDETFLVDRKTTVREYLKQFREIMTLEPPEELKERYGG
mmetsp:Transcript_4727/g.10404  ORF Transcript_4727/g.10404 Transcript_4727/m.10404 type:complete len:417 (-) Transcript_4727:113-1363(-)